MVVSQDATTCHHPKTLTMSRKIEPSFIADILTEPDIKNAVPRIRLDYMRRFANGEGLKSIAAIYQKSLSHIYTEIARGIDDRRIYQSIIDTPEYTLKCHLHNLNNAMHHFHTIGAHRSSSDIRRCIRNLIEVLNPPH
jgi:hypothetical protein